MKEFILDLETKPIESLTSIVAGNIKPKANLKDVEKIREDLKEKALGVDKKMRTSPDLCEIRCFGFKEIGQPSKLITLQEFADILSDTRENYRIYTFNGKQFDIPVIIKQGLRQGINLPYIKLKNMCNKFNTADHCDLMNLLCDSFGDNKSLDFYLQVYCGKSKDTKGDDFFKNATQDEIEKHCLEDLDYEEELIKLFKPIIS